MFVAFGDIWAYTNFGLQNLLAKWQGTFIELGDAAGYTGGITYYFPRELLDATSR
jgi:hypothetical protein